MRLVIAILALVILTGTSSAQSAPPPGVVRSELVEARTDDGVVLHGGLWIPTTRTTSTGVLIIHGSFREFYEYGAMASRFADIGVLTLSMNQRDHGFLSGFRLFEPSSLDIKYAVDLLIARGASDVVLVGHSYGTVLISGYLATTMDARVKAAVLLAPLDDSRLRAAATLGTDAAMDGMIKKAREMVAAGRGREPFLATTNVVSLQSYEVFLDKRGPESKAVAPELLKKVPGTIPILAVKDPADPQGGRLADAKQHFEAASKNLRFIALPEMRERRPDSQAHDFVGREMEVFDVMRTWLAEHRLVP